MGRKCVTFSVVIPNYCHAKYLEQRIQSVLNQTFQDFEVIILDDCSSDNGKSKSIIEKYRNNPHVSHIIYNEENSGSTFKQWDKGICLAKGEWIWIAESDDYSELTFLSTLIREIKKYNNVSVAYTSSILVDANGIPTIKQFDYNYKLDIMNGVDFIKNKMFISSAIFNASSAVFKKKYALAISKDYIEYKAGGDRRFWISMAEKGCVLHVNEKLNYFRQHTQKVSPKRQIDGTTLREDYRTNSYLIESGYLAGWRLFQSNLHYFKQIYYGSFKSEEIKINLFKLWGYDSKWKIVLMLLCKKVISRLYLISNAFRTAN